MIHRQVQMLQDNFLRCGRGDLMYHINGWSNGWDADRKGNFSKTHKLREKVGSRDERFA